MSILEDYYNRFDEEHRLSTRHGIVEFTVTLKYIHECIGERKSLSILDLGAGTGRYSVALAQEGHTVTAVELVEKNRKRIEAKHQTGVHIWPGNALDLSFLDAESFDIALVFGPMYHLHSKEERLKVFEQVKRVTKKDGFILVAYVMNEYSIIEYCFKKAQIASLLKEKRVTKDFHTVSSKKDLYSYLRLEDINELNEAANLKRVKIIAADGPSDYMRRELNAMDEETFKIFIDYQLATAERTELLGASSHTVDILKR
ncbi:methyltransferase domain-containing protein [Treponema pectinovorum]|uniref:class I SAM-dependent methyltransferase n=1 Tax=Treponema pectinovorum TaxID=164 RepID=UPI003D945B6E